MMAAALLAGGLSICHQQAARSASATRSRQMRRQQQLLLLLLQLLLLGVGATAAAAAAPALAAPTRPRVEYTEGEAALGIDDAPRFGWTLPCHADVSPWDNESRRCVAASNLPIICESQAKWTVFLWRRGWLLRPQIK